MPTNQSARQHKFLHRASHLSMIVHCKIKSYHFIVKLFSLSLTLSLSVSLSTLNLFLYLLERERADTIITLPPPPHHHHHHHRKLFLISNERYGQNKTFLLQYYGIDFAPIKRNHPLFFLWFKQKETQIFRL